MRWIPIMVLGFLMGFQAQVHGDDYRRLSGEPREPAQFYKLYYMFSADDAVHRLHAEELEALSRSFRHRLQVVRIARTQQGADANADPLPDIRRHHDLSYRLWSGIEWTRKTNLPAKSIDQLREEDDYALLFDNKGELVASGTGSDLSRILSTIPPEGTRTEVGQSTWGKIKELFR